MCTTLDQTATEIQFSDNKLLLLHKNVISTLETST